MMNLRLSAWSFYLKVACYLKQVIGSKKDLIMTFKIKMITFYSGGCDVLQPLLGLLDLSMLVKTLNCISLGRTLISTLSSFFLLPHLPKLILYHILLGLQSQY